MVDKWPINTYVGVRCPFRADLVVYRLLPSHVLKFIHFLSCGHIITSKRLSLFSVIVLDGEDLRRINVLTTHDLCDKRRSLPVGLRLQTERAIRLLLQMINGGKLLFVRIQSASFGNLKYHRGIKEMAANYHADYFPIVVTWNLWIEDTFEPRDLYEDKP